MEAFPWLFAVLGGAVILALVIAYGAIRSSKATTRQKDAAEQGQLQLGEEEFHRRGVDKFQLRPADRFRHQREGREQ